MTNAASDASNSDSVPLPQYVPPDAVQLTEYAEIVEVLRSPAMRPEPSLENAPFNDGALVTLFGAEHTKRRRIMNRVVRPEALEYYREHILLPTLAKQLSDLRASPEDDGLCRANLVSFTKSTFLRFAAAIVLGTEVATGEDAVRLGHLIDQLRLATRVKFQLGDHAPLIANGLEAKREFRSTFYQAAVDGCPIKPGDSVDGNVVDLMSLLAAHADPAWEDDGLRLREATSVIIGAVDSTASITTHAVDELDRWFAKRPQARHLSTDLPFLSRAIQETLRLHPVIPAFTRIATEDVVLSTGTKIQKNKWVAGMTLPAAHDRRLFGAKAGEFDPHREVSSEVPRYGLAFGSGPHQCIGLRLVLGNDGVGIGAHVLRQFYLAGIERDLSRHPSLETSLQRVFIDYPVIFRFPASLQGGQDG